MKGVAGRNFLQLDYSKNGYISSTFISGEHKLNVIIDTGAERSILKKDVLSFVPHKKNKRITIKLSDFFGNITEAQLARVKRIGFGSFELRNFSYIFSDNFYGPLGSKHIQGIVGLDILEYFDLYFTSNENILGLMRAKRKQEDPNIWNSENMVEKNNLWGIYLSIDNKQVFAVIDTGFPDSFSIPESLQKEINWIPPTDEELSLFHLWDNDNERITRIIIKRIKIFNQEMLELSAVVNPNINTILIGLDLLKKFDSIISFKREKIYFKR